ncbi:MULTISPECIES: lipid-transfer protein [Spongiibacter]|uniref:lipid-transfer protein n=1 Tax=Spongiibacter TaxID=630749 RepID=UPI001B2BA4A5|nr:MULTISPECIES: lipid-transfer protein [Spongiibacter]MBO6751784.1 lipid-transfer protein [Spongiibacter sp.]
MSRTYVAGVGMVKFAKPGSQQPYRQMAKAAIDKALTDAGFSFADVDQAFAGYIYGDSCCGQHAIYDAGMSGIPIFNVNNNCASGSTALYLARQAIQSGSAECVLVLGFEEMFPGAISSQWDQHESPFKRFDDALDNMGYPTGPLALRCFGAAGHHYVEKYGAEPSLFAEVAVKTRRHATKNPLALFNAPLTVDEVMAGPPLYMNYLTRLMCCPPTCGAAAALLCSDDFLRQRGVDQAIEIAGQGMATDTASSWDDPMQLVGAGMSRAASQLAYEQAGVGPDDLDLVELHDCFTTNEVISYEALGLCGEGEASRFVADGQNSYGGSVVVNPSGGLMSKGHPIGATGLAQCYELVSQLRGQAGERQVDNARHGLQHNIGLGGAAVVTLYRRP